MGFTSKYRLLDYLLGLIWLVMGLYCKVLAFVPRHKMIVSEILGNEVAPTITPLIGIGEIFLGLLIITGYQRKFISVIQIILVLLMNLLESMYAAEYLLWGSLNFIFALIFCGIVYFNGFYRHREKDA